MVTNYIRISFLGAAALALCACSGGGPSDAPVVAPPVAADTLTLSGIVTDNPIVNASVMVRVGASEFSGAPLTGSNGEFSLQIESQDPNALVIAEAADAVNGVKLSAVLDTFAGCRALARNGVVDGVKVTNVTTAQQVLAERLASDGSVDSYDEFAMLAEQIDATELLDLSAALKVVIENIDGNVLPAGVGDTMALAQAIAAGNSTFFGDLAIATPGALATARDRLLSDGNATVPFAAADAPGVYMSIDDNFTYAVFDNGTALADFYDDNPVPGTPSWSLNDLGQLVVTYYGFTRQSDNLSSIGRAADVVHLVTGGVDTDGSAIAATASNVRKYAFGAAFDVSEVSGAWTDPMNESYQWVFAADGSGYRLNLQTQVTSENFAWSINDNGRIVMDFVGSIEQMEVGRLSTDGTVLTISRFDGQWAALNVAGFVRADAG